MRNIHRHIGILIPVLLFIALLLIFSLERLAIRILQPEVFTGILTAQTLKAMAIGLRFDANTAALLSCPFIVLVFAGPLFTRRWFQRSIAGLLAVLLGLTVFGCIADYYFFKQFSERLNHKALVYLNDDYVYQILWNDYPMVTIGLVFCLTCLGVYAMANRLITRRVRAGGTPALSIAEVIVVPTVMTALAVFGIRGTLGPKAINTGPAYFSSSAPLAQLTLNGLFTLREAAISLAYRDEDLAASYTLLPPAEAIAETTALVIQPGDTPQPTASNPLRRITDTGRPRQDYNVVLVVLESLSWQYIGAMGARPDYTPHFNKLIAEGLFMDECFAVGNRTTRGFSAIVSGYPDLPGKSVSTRSQSEGRFLTLGTILKSRGYKTMFIYGGQPSYDHRQAFLGSNGYTSMIFHQDFACRTFEGELGLCDEDLFNQTLLELRKPHDQPLFATLLTLSFHRSFRIPPDRITPEPASTEHHEEIDSIRYTDWAIGRFIENAKTLPDFDKTLFVFVADHMGGFKEKPTTAASYRVPFLIYAPQLVPPARRSGTCSQLDVAPTIMHLLGGSYEHCFFGSSVLNRNPEAGFAWILNGQQLIYINGRNQGVTISPNHQQDFFQFSLPNTIDPLFPGASTQQLSRLPISILQVADQLFRNDAYNLLPAPDDRSRP